MLARLDHPNVVKFYESASRISRREGMSLALGLRPDGV